MFQNKSCPLLPCSDENTHYTFVLCRFILRGENRCSEYFIGRIQVLRFRAGEKFSHSRRSDIGPTGDCDCFQPTTLAPPPACSAGAPDPLKELVKGFDQRWFFCALNVRHGCMVAHFSEPA